MQTSESLQAWLDLHRLDYIIWDERNFSIKDIGKFYVVKTKQVLGEDAIFNNDFELIMDAEESNALMDDEEIAYVAFTFGQRWYYAEGQSVTELKEIKYLGEEREMWAPESIPPFLGIHGGYDLCNGSRSYADWCKKAQFAGYTALGISEENTLAGVLAFQNACDKVKIKPVIGEMITVDDDGTQYSVKVYVANEQGWRNLLLINAEINVHNHKFIKEADLFKRASGLYCALSFETDLKKIPKFKKAGFENVYFQFEVSQWDSDERDKAMLGAMQNYLKNYRDKIDPILVCDAYYLEAKDAKIRRDLNAIGKLSFKFQSRDQHFKTPNEIFAQIEGLFREDDDRFIDVANAAIASARFVVDNSFKIETGKLHLPQYVMSPNEAANFATREDLFWSIIEDGLQKKIIDKGIEDDELQQYIERVQMEAKVILDANLHDYFLIIWDILNWAQENGIRTGYGRGSAGGSMVAYAMDIVKTDPLKYGLIFERFLNEGRLYKKKKVMVDGVETEIKVTGSMPDIDNDIQGSRRNEVKRYIESKYGVNRVSSIGTYGTFKAKAALKDLSRRSGADQQYTNYMTGAIDDDEVTYTGLFIHSNKISKFDAPQGRYIPSIVKEYMQANPELIDKLPLIFDQPKIASMHAAGVIIVPESEYGIYDQIPVKMVDGVLVSEWEMDFVEQAGFLKMDILGLKQLDKFDEILKLVKETSGEDIVMEEIPLDDPKVYSLFSLGYNEDVFQFGGFGLKGYTLGLQPENINDLIATTALYRPGPIEIGAHESYIKRKNGKEEVSYAHGTENALGETYGLMCYQEQIMQIVKDMAGFTLNETDDVRKAIGKKLPELMKQYQERFVDGCVKNGYDKHEATALWKNIEVFGGYSFNKSHSVCYGITGYHSQWLKANYPLQFWTVALKHSTDDQIIARLSEIRATSDIKISPADVNKSGLTYEMDAVKNTIYWTISSVKQAGAVSVKNILDDRAANGEYFSIEEFGTRLKGKVDKRATVNMIISGAFDEMYGVKSPRERFSILEKFFIFRKEKMSEELLLLKGWKDFNWTIEQRRLSGLGTLDFKSLVYKNSSFTDQIRNYCDCKEILDTDASDLPVPTLMAGLITKVTQKVTKGDRPFMLIDVNDGAATISGVIWSDTIEKYKDLLKDPMGKLIVMTVKVTYDSKFRKANSFATMNEKESRPTIVNIIE